jgi:hypothetical protein
MIAALWEKVYLVREGFVQIELVSYSGSVLTKTKFTQKLLMHSPPQYEINFKSVRWFGRWNGPDTWNRLTKCSHYVPGSKPSFIIITLTLRTSTAPIIRFDESTRNKGADITHFKTRLSFFKKNYNLLLKKVHSARFESPADGSSWPYLNFPFRVICRLWSSPWDYSSASWTHGTPDPFSLCPNSCVTQYSHSRGATSEQ